ncbi:small subunit ribosomal protein S11e [Podila verticillata NRRL 6337]|nr:small subunit ribosomal protein S11e [Podila verticillata NRRL 6337]
MHWGRLLATRPAAREHGQQPRQPPQSLWRNFTANENTHRIALLNSTKDSSPNNQPGHIKPIEKAFQKQQGIFQNSKVAGKKSVKNSRWYKEVGLGFKTPKEAIEGHYIDKKCPFTGDVSIRGRILTGEIISTKMKRTIIIRREYLHFISKYNRYEKRHKNLAAHMSPAFIGVQQGDSVTVGQCRPLSKTVRFNVLKVQKKVVKGAKNFAKF